MKNQTVINRYAHALLNIGLDDGRYVEYGLELRGLAEVLSALGEETRALTSPSYPEGVRQKMLDLILDKAALSPIVSNFINLLMDKDHLGELGEIAIAYNDLADAEKGLVRARVTSAAPLPGSVLKSLQTVLSQFAGRQVELALDHDPALIGGLVAQMGDLTIDGSVRTQLEKLTARLTTLY
jgi:F-type H+-transporting ATPase subunit delta